MPTNLLRKYPQLLELGHLTETQRTVSLRGVFDRDIMNNLGFRFRRKQIHPVRGQEPEMDLLFRHLTTCKATDLDPKAPEGKRVFEMARSQRLHWVKHHIDESTPDNIFVFTTEERVDGKPKLRTYILDHRERYVVILEPLRTGMDYYLLTAYALEPRNFKKMKSKAKRRLKDVL